MESVREVGVKNLLLKLILILFFSANFNFLNSRMVFASNMNSEINFSDIQGHWAKDNITKLVEMNIISGYTDKTFKPEKNVTVAEFLKMVVVAGEYPLVRSGDSVWPDFYIETAIDRNLISNNEFDDYNRVITRYEIASIISRFVDTSEVKENKNTFKDLDENHKSQVLKLVKLKIINGYEDKTYRGENNVTSAEAATILYKSLNARDELVLKRKYNLNESTDLTNYKNEDDKNKSSIKTYYEIKENKLYIYDHGRYAKLDAYQISNKNINIKKVIKIIKNLITEKGYVAVVYSPSEYTIDQLRILYGETEINTLSNEYDFSFTYYEDDLYELARISGVEEFSEECYLKIEVLKMWDEISDYKNGIYIDEYKRKKLQEALETEFGSTGKKILEYMLEKNIQYVTNVDRNKKHIEQKKFGKYTINFYQKESGVPQFYIEK